MPAIARKSDRKPGWTPPAADFHEEYYPVQSFAWIGKSGDSATDFPHCGNADFDRIEDAGIAGLDHSAHGDACYLIWRVPQQMNITEPLGVQLVYTSTASPSETTNSVSGKVAWKLACARVGEGDEMSGAPYVTPQDNGADFAEITYSGNAAYSGQAKLMTSTWAEIDGHVHGSPESGTNFRHGDLVIFRFTRDSGSASAVIPVALLGATIRYRRDRL
ncbi:MAG: hypothetical protein FJ118_12380 [Deltaproteobacteria bacterium]|nr:hypothetical protein [Deltaproteobacteria bacterium]